MRWRLLFSHFALGVDLETACCCRPAPLVNDEARSLDGSRREREVGKAIVLPTAVLFQRLDAWIRCLPSLQLCFISGPERCCFVRREN
jgi:hypothetical protein